MNPPGYGMCSKAGDIPVRVVCRCFEAQGLTFKTREAVYLPSCATLGHERTPESALSHSMRRVCLSLFYRAVKYTSPLPGTFSRHVF